MAVDPRIVLVTILAGALAGCSLTGDCTNDIVSRAPSPDGAREAIVFRRSCGATTTDSIHLWIGRVTAHDPDAQGDALVLDSVPPGKALKTVWSAPSHLEVTIARGARVFRRADHVEQVAIRYRQG